MRISSKKTYGGREVLQGVIWKLERQGKWRYLKQRFWAWIWPV